ncbi:MAG: hypothetical protein ACKVU4_14210 [Phycisphaerales bacterium]
MPRRHAVFALATAGLVLGIGSIAGAQIHAPALPAAAAALRQAHPGVQFGLDEGRVRYIYGAPMTWGATPDAAASQFLQFHGGAFGVGALSLQFRWSTPVQNDRFTAYIYSQFIDNLPVEYGNARVLVLNGIAPRVVYAAGTLAAKPEGGWPRATISGAQAVASLQNMDQYAGLPVYTTPSAVIWQGTWPTTAPRRAWKFEGYVPGIGGNKSYTFFVDMATGALLEARDEIHTTDVSGTVRGWGTPNVLPDLATNAPVLMAMPEITMSVAGGSSAFSERDGDFTVPNAGTSTVTLNSNVSGGRWVNVNAATVAELSYQDTNVVPGTAVDARYNIPQPTPANSPNTAQVNTFVHTNNIHNYYTDRAPGFTEINVILPANTGVAGTCNAFFTTGPPASINFYNTGGGCNNTAYSTVIAHEYGHFVVNRLGLAQGAFGEGSSDAGAILLFDTGIVGESFYTTGANIRNPATANQQYPCTSTAIHTCGQIVGGVWYETRVNFGAAFGSAAGLDMVRDLHVAWSQITTGGSGLNSAHPGTAIEVLTVDDNDGNLANGTPNYGLICNAFDQHNIDCPVISLLVFSYPNGQPASVTPGQATPLRVNVAGVSATPAAGSGMIHTSLDFAPFTAAPMSVVGTNQYEGSLPAVQCGQTLRYYVSAQTTTGTTVTDPASAPAAAFSTQGSLASATQVTVADLNFQADPGWTVTNTAVSTGAWERVVPIAPAPTGAPGADFDGSGLCWVTDNRAGNFDVDGGPTTITTSAYDLSAFGAAKLSYARWIYSQNGNVDPYAVQVSSNNGSTWTTLESVTATAGSWVVKEFDLGAFISLTSQVRVRFLATDNPNDSVTEAGLDRFRIVGYQCEAPCYPDCTGEGTLSVADFGCFQGKYVLGDLYADCNGSGTLTVADFGCFQGEYVIGCP